MLMIARYYAWTRNRGGTLPSSAQRRSCESRSLHLTDAWSNSPIQNPHVVSPNTLHNCPTPSASEAKSSLC
jgi:hypothetical protein